MEFVFHQTLTFMQRVGGTRLEMKFVCERKTASNIYRNLLQDAHSVAIKCSKKGVLDRSNGNSKFTTKKKIHNFG